MPDYSKEYGKDYSTQDRDGESRHASKGYAMGTVRTGAGGVHAGAQSARSGAAASRHIAHSSTGIARKSSTGYLNAHAGVRRFNRVSSPFKTATAEGAVKRKTPPAGYVPPYSRNGGRSAGGYAIGPVRWPRTMESDSRHAGAAGKALSVSALSRYSALPAGAGAERHGSYSPGHAGGRPGGYPALASANPTQWGTAVSLPLSSTPQAPSSSRTGVHAPRQILASQSVKVAGSGQSIAAAALTRGQTRGAGSTPLAARAAGMGIHGLVRASTGLARAGGVVLSQRERLMPSDGRDQTSTVSSRAVGLGRRAVGATGARAWRAARFAFHHRRQIMRGAKATGHGLKLAAAGAQRAATVISQLAARAVRAVTTVVTQVAAVATTALGLPVLVIVSVVLVIVLMFTSLFGADNTQTGVQNVPSEYESDVLRAGSLCTEVTPALIAAQIEAESNWDPDAVSPAGAQGIAQFMPGTWASHGLDGDGDKKADVFNPHDAIYSQGMYMCELAQSVNDALDAHRIDGNRTDLILAAYNAGMGNVLRYGGVPPFSETVYYVQHIKSLIEKYSAEGEPGGGFEVGDIKDKPLVMSGDGWHVNIAAMGIPARSTTYELWQCTWWASVRRAQIGKPVDGYMGNGGQWDDSARRLGYPTGRDARAGDVISFEPGVLGSSPIYGHVAIVEKVNADGSILISESGANVASVVTRTLTAAQLQMAGAGITFIH